MSLLSFDLEILNLTCVVGNNPVDAYLVRQLVAPLSVPLILITIAMKKLTQQTTDTIVEFLNTLGSVFNLFFIAIILSALNPFICYDHPGDAGSSLYSNSSILCFDSQEHSHMVSIGIIAFIMVPMPFLVLVLYFTCMYPTYMATFSMKSVRMLNASRFLFFRFKPAGYYFGAIMCIRSLCICLVPVVISTSVATQIVVMALVLGAYIIGQQQRSPWKF